MHYCFPKKYRILQKVITFVPVPTACLSKLIRDQELVVLVSQLWNMNPLDVRRNPWIIHLTFSVLYTVSFEIAANPSIVKKVICISVETTSTAKEASTITEFPNDFLNWNRLCTTSAIINYLLKTRKSVLFEIPWTLIDNVTANLWSIWNGTICYCWSEIKYFFNQYWKILILH